MEKVGQVGDLHIIMQGCAQRPSKSHLKLYKQGTTHTDQIEEDERSRETEKGLVHNPSENNLKTLGKTKISLELGVQSKSRDNRLFFC